jgi:uncharacterized glyoxalase superfamily protein PhnB
MRYRDAPAAIDFLERAFGFVRREVIANEDGTIAHAELSLGPSILMLGSDRDDPLVGSRAGKGWIYVAIDDPDEHCARARAPARPARRSSPSYTTPITARATTPRETSTATCGTSAPIAPP